jgi:hypothetical protein
VRVIEQTMDCMQGTTARLPQPYEQVGMWESRLTAQLWGPVSVGQKSRMVSSEDMVFAFD